MKKRPIIRPEDTARVFFDAMPPAHKDLITSRTKAEFDDAFSRIVLDSVHKLEKDSKNLCILSEDGLSTVFVGFVNGTNALRVTREENSNGHVDMTFHAPLCNPAKEVLGEAKIFQYYEWHEKGLSQLITRYSTGRQERGLLLVYVKKPGIKGHMAHLRSKCDEIRPCEQISLCCDHNAKWSFVSTHRHSSGEELEVWHLGCNLHYPERQTNKTKAVRRSRSNAAGI